MGGRDALFPGEVTPEMRLNAADMVAKANTLLENFGCVRRCNSGFRPRSINENIPGAAKGSAHLTCNAIDIEDHDGSLKKYCVANLDLLQSIGLWMEHPMATPTWCHVQRIPPKSGKRIFIPNAQVAARIAAQRR